MKKQIKNRGIMFMIIGLSLSIASCKKDEVPVAPSLTTAGVNAITQTTSTCGGNITSNGGSTVTARGVCWSTVTTPTTADSKTSDGGGSGIFSSSLASLTPNTTYSVRAYATNSAGTGYGSVVSFTTLAIPLPEMTTTAVTNITLTTATSGGNIISDGGLQVSARGVCWSVSASPTIANSKSSDGSGIGNFVSSITGLAANTTYIIRAYATTSAGTGYGSAVSFTTPQLPLLTTSAASNIGLTAAGGGGNITAAGSSAITARGICWSTLTNPTIVDNTTSDGAGIGAFTSTMTGLTINTTYYVKAYATNSAGTTYGNEVTFTTYGLEDIDGNLYHSVVIGAQEWMKENLKTKTYSDGNVIPNVTDPTAWIGLTSGAYSDFDNNVNNVATYGRLYNWFAVLDAHQLCPAGWHIPDDADWDTLVTTVGGADLAGGKMKSTGTVQDGTGLWNSPNTGASNDSKFTGLPAGHRDDTGAFGDLHSYGHWWSSIGDSNSGYFRRLQDSHTKLERFGNSPKNGKSVRCLKN